MGKNKTNNQKEKDELFKSVLRERLAYKSKQKKKFVEPIIEPSNIDRLMDNLTNKEEFSDLRSLDFKRIPPTNFKEFNSWKFFHDKMWFERSLDIWRQFHITLKAEHLFFVVDGREPNFFFEPDILCFIKENNLTIIVNKSDLITQETKDECLRSFKNVIFYSAKFQEIENNPLLKFIEESDKNIFGLIGYPNVGKSSIINSLLNTKKVKTSSTPGKTKFAQTLFINEKKLIDCPGLVFPRHPKADLVLRGVLNVDQTNFNDSFNFIIEKVGILQILKELKCKNFINDSRYELMDNFFSCVRKQRGWDRGIIIKKVVKDYFEGKLKITNEKLEIEKNYDWMNLKKNVKNKTKKNVYKILN